MAIFKPTIFQDISGSVGNVTSYKVGKTQIARGKPGFVKDAQTPEQLKQRARLSLITAVSSKSYPLATAPPPVKYAPTVSPVTIFTK